MSAQSTIEAEMAIVGATLFDNRLVDRVTLAREHFFDPVLGDMWAEISARVRAGRAVDALSLREWFSKRAPELPLTFLLDVSNTHLLSVHAIEYAEIIRQAARRRAVISAAREAIAMAEAGEGDALTELEAHLQEIAAQGADAEDWTPIARLAEDAAERAELGETKGISTGFEGLDRMTGGIQPGTLWVVGAATSMGKSVFGGALARNVASQGFGVADVHLEMDKTQIGLRTAAALTFNPDPKRSDENPYYLSAMRADMTPRQWARLREGALHARRLPIYVDARPGRTLPQIEAAARRLFRKMQREQIKPGALIIDHEGLIVSEGRHPSQLEAANARAAGLLSIAKRLDVGVIALSQITKEGSRADGDERLPQATDLNYGSALSQAASVVILLHRRAYYAERIPEDRRSHEQWEASRSRECTLVVDMARGGQRAQVKVLMDWPTAAVWEQAA